jgi:putative ABC transport system permease protein
MVPALRASRFELRKWTRNTASRRVLVIAEIALAMTLLTAAGLMIRTFRALQSVDPGFAVENLLTMTVSVAGTAQSPGPRRIAFFDELMARIKGMPGVESASATNHLPLYGDRWVYPVSIEGREPPAGQLPGAVYRVSHPDYFRTMRIPLAAGRDFSPGDNAESPRAGIVNRAMASRRWPGENALGKRFRLGTQGSWITIVGVAGNVKNSDWKEEAAEEIYLPYLQSPDHLNSPAPHFSYLTVVIRTVSDPETLTGAVRRAVRDLEPSAPVSSVVTMEEVVSRVLARSRLSMALLGFFGLAALVLAAGGIYGIMSYAVAIRAQEIGVRVALGARPRSILRLVISEGILIAASGAIAGLLASLAATRLMTSMLFGVGPADVPTFAGMTLVLMAVTVAACVIPARRAMRADPIQALRAL